MRRAHALGITALAAASLTLTACEKPAPGVTVFSGPRSVTTAAQCWAFTSDQLSPGECAAEILNGETTDGVEQLPVSAGNTVGISVDPVVAESGWNIVIGGQQLSQTPLTTTYFRFTLPLQVGTQTLPLQIVSGQNTKIRGVWIVALQPGLS